MTFTRAELALIETSLFIASSFVPDSFKDEHRELQERISAELTKMKLEENMNQSIKK